MNVIRECFYFVQRNWSGRSTEIKIVQVIHWKRMVSVNILCKAEMKKEPYLTPFFFFFNLLLSISTNLFFFSEKISNRTLFSILVDLKYFYLRNSHSKNYSLNRTQVQNASKLNEMNCFFSTQSMISLCS